MVADSVTYFEKHSPVQIYRKNEIFHVRYFPIYHRNFPTRTKSLHNRGHKSRRKAFPPNAKALINPFLPHNPEAKTAYRRDSFAPL